MSVGTGRQNIILLEIIVSFLGIHKWDPSIVGRKSSMRMAKNLWLIECLFYEGINAYMAYCLYCMYYSLNSWLYSPLEFVLFVHPVQYILSVMLAWVS
jgi:hypothetical protein